MAIKRIQRTHPAHHASGSTVRETLATHGLRATPQRITILEALRDSNTPLSAEALHQAITSRFDLATVYRTLESGVEYGILEQVSLGDESAHYEWAGCHHHHIVCTSCKVSSPVHICLSPKAFTDALSESPTFSRITNHSIQMFGLCCDCAQKSH